MLQVIVPDISHERVEQGQPDPNTAVANHQNEQHGEGDRYKAVDMRIAVGRQTAQFVEQLKRAAPPAFDQLGGGSPRTG